MVCQPEAGSNALACHLPLQLLLASLPACNTIQHPHSYAHAQCVCEANNKCITIASSCLQAYSVWQPSPKFMAVYEGTTATAQI